MYSSIWDFFLPSAGSLMGNLTRSLSLATTTERSAEYSVLMSLSSKLAKWWKPKTFW
ncbi:hypothetical protein D3C87_2145600 [compost metagenome]